MVTLSWVVKTGPELRVRPKRRGPRLKDEHALARDDDDVVLRFKVEVRVGVQEREVEHLNMGNS